MNRDPNRPTPSAAANAAGTAATTAPIARGGASSGAFWRHNSSVMQFQLDAQNSSNFSIVYGNPRSGLSALGIGAGTILFRGTRRGNLVIGQAITFSRNCGTQGYDVTGEIHNETRFILRGQKPVRNGGCKTTGNVPEQLEFELVTR